MRAKINGASASRASMLQAFGGPTGRRAILLIFNDCHALTMSKSNGF
jgi:hypothetical protein